MSGRERRERRQPGRGGRSRHTRTADGREPAVRPSRRRRLFAATALAATAAPWVLAGYVVLTLAAGTLPVAAAWFTKTVVDRVSGGPAAGGLLAPAALLAATGVLAAVFPQVAQYLRARLDRRAGLLAMERLFTAVERFTGLRHFEDPGFLDRLRLSQQASRVAPNQTVDAALGLIRSLITGAGLLGTLLLLSPLMTALVLLSGLPMLLAELDLSRRRAHTLWAVSPAERREAFYAELLTSVQAAKEVRLFGLGPFLRGRMAAERRVSDRGRAAVDRREVLVQAGLALLAALLSGAGLVWAVGQARSGGLTVGDVMIFVAAVAGIQGALTSFAADLARAHQALRSFEHFLTVLGTPSDLPVPRRPLPLPELRRGIELRDVWFRYGPDQPWVLRGVTLHIAHGATLGLVGLNGAGKSTLVKLLCRFYDPTRGAVLWDGVDLRDAAPEALRERISVVFQDYMEYELTAAENIALGELTALDDPDRIRAAADRAGIHRRLAELPRGYETLLTRTYFTESDKDDPELGVVLSGGQWQRLALARALLRHRRDLMILDEPSSGLDAAAEHEVHSSLAAHREGRTSLLISHRLGALRVADRIVVLAEGRIAEQGTHGELLGAAGEYARLFTLQAQGYRPAPDATASANTAPGAAPITAPGAPDAAPDRAARTEPVR
ncbi:ABC transporter ATP-binding protein [Streptomyces sp. IBSNAI002]|uniref:ABC transporter ATP-binding protein n=1 Tax=Streptomyces sp. IBSNAI002 TaxID=3457500 RepID=UPI003FD30B6F